MTKKRCRDSGFFSAGANSQPLTGRDSSRRPKYEAKKPKGARLLNDDEEEMSRFRLFLGRRQQSAFDWPRLDCAKQVRGIRYGLINVCTDGKRLFFAQLEEMGKDWSVATLSAN